MQEEEKCKKNEQPPNTVNPNTYQSNYSANEHRELRTSPNFLNTIEALQKSLRLTEPPDWTNSSSLISNALRSSQETLRLVNAENYASKVSAFSTAMQAMQDSLRLTAPANYLADGLASSAAIKAMRDSLRLTEPLNYFTDYSAVSSVMKTVHDGISTEISNYMRHFLKLTDSPLESVRKEMALFQDQQTKLQDIFRSSFLEAASLQNNLRDTVSSLLSQIGHLSEEIEHNSLTVSDEALIVAEGHSVSLSEATIKIEELISRSKVVRSIVQGQQDIAETLQKLTQEIQKQGHPIRLILSILILPLLVSLLSHFLEPYVDSLGKATLSKKELVKQIQVDAMASGLQSHDLTDLRLVIATSLRVREQPSKEAQPLGKLHKGQLVRLIHKGRHWSLIEFSEDTVRLKGWVFTRYLERIDQYP